MRVSFIAVIVLASVLVAAVLPASPLAATMRTAGEPVELAKDDCIKNGKGFSRIPGTNACVKLGGFVRSQGILLVNKKGDDYTWSKDYLGLFNISMDVKSVTSYGKLRGYGTANFAAGGKSSLHKFLLQLDACSAGYDNSKSLMFGGYLPNYKYGRETYPSIASFASCTLTFPHGFNATFAIEDRAPGLTEIADTNGQNADAPKTQFHYVVSDKGVSSTPRQVAPNVVLVLGVEQGWGSAKVMGLATHAPYYDPDKSDLDSFGMAAGVGFEVSRIVIPMGKTQRVGMDKFGMRVVYSAGSVKHATAFFSNDVSGALKVRDFSISGSGDDAETSRNHAISGHFGSTHKLSDIVSLSLGLGYSVYLDGVEPTGEDKRPVAHRQTVGVAIAVKPAAHLDVVLGWEGARESYTWRKVDSGDVTFPDDTRMWGLFGVRVTNSF